MSLLRTALDAASSRSIDIHLLSRYNIGYVTAKGRTDVRPDRTCVCAIFLVPASEILNLLLIWYGVLYLHTNIFISLIKTVGFEFTGRGIRVWTWEKVGVYTLRLVCKGIFGSDSDIDADGTSNFTLD